MKEGRRVVVDRFCDTPLDAIEHAMKLEPLPPPDTSKLGPRDVVVAIEAAQVGWVDLLMTSGQYQHLPKPPYVPGLEWAGTVAWKGADVELAVGERVLVNGFLAGPRSLGAYQAYGGFASYGVAPAEAVLRIPGKLSFDQACCLLGNYETAFHCLVTRGKLAKGETVLVLGASGATGLAAVHVAKLLGATVIAAGRSEDKLAIVKSQGADHVVAGPLRDAVKSLTNGQGVDVVYDGVGGAASLEALRCVKFGARFLVVGWASTPFVAKEKSPNQLPTNLVMMKGLDVLGCPTVISTVMNPALGPPRLAAVLQWAERGEIAPYVSKTFALDDFQAAMRAKWAGEIVGGCTVKP
ncbi:MAG TPA: NADPH:quinone oxidoreductase family protein [Polyangiaceae bacterium]|jgi:NADPH2:quinone reductase